MKKLQQPLFSCYLEVLVVFAMSFLRGSCMQAKFLKGAKAHTGFSNVFFFRGVFYTYMNCKSRQSCQLPLHSMYCTLPIDVNMYMYLRANQIQKIECISMCYY